MRFIILITFLMSSVSALAADAKMTLDRNLGLLIGDQVTATVELPVDTSQLDKHSLPAHEKRYGPWLVLHDLSMHDHTLILEFQLINVPAENRSVTTPELSLRTVEGDFINLPQMPLQIGSFLEPGEGRAAHLPLADAPLPEHDSHLLKQQLWWGLLVLLLSTLVWLVWHFGLRPRKRLPFATALFELNKMRLLGRKDKDEASRSLHHAFNRCAGRVVIHSQLDKLWQACPWLEPLKDDIESFYAQSAVHFFSRDAAEAKDFDQLLSLTKACRAREKVA